MTNQTTTTTTPTITPAADVADDPRPGFARAVALCGSVIAGVRADQLADPTPCDAFDVRQLLGHLVFAMRRVAAVAGGESPFIVDEGASGVGDDGWRTAWEQVADEVQAAWADDAVLERALVLPFATLPGRVTLSIYTSEVTVHTWDLAVATGQSPAWDDSIVSSCLATMQAALAADRRGGEIPFAQVVPVAEDAALIDRLVGWVGRTPV